MAEPKSLKMSGTINQIAAAAGVSSTEANGFVKTCVALGFAKETGVAPKTEKQKGRAAAIFTIAVGPAA